jgi:hypothetical protein
MWRLGSEGKHSTKSVQVLNLWLGGVKDVQACGQTMGKKQIAYENKGILTAPVPQQTTIGGSSEGGKERVLETTVFFQSGIGQSHRGRP